MSNPRPGGWLDELGRLKQAEQGVSLEAQEAKIRAMATVQGASLFEVIVDGGESAKNLNRPGLQRLTSSRRFVGFIKR